MVHLLTWPRIRLVVRAATIYPRCRGRKHHFRWLLRWRNLPVRASLHGLLRLTAYLRLASCLSTPGWMCIGIEYRQTASSFLFLPLSKSSARFYESSDLIDRTTSSSPPSLSPAFLLPSFLPSPSFLSTDNPRTCPFAPSAFHSRSRLDQHPGTSHRSPQTCGFGLRFNYKPPGKLAASSGPS